MRVLSRLHYLSTGFIAINGRFQVVLLSSDGFYTRQRAGLSDFNPETIYYPVFCSPQIKGFFMKLPKVETLIVFAFLGIVALWGISKCSASRSDLVRRLRGGDKEEKEERPVRRDTVVVKTPAPQQAPVNTQAPVSVNGPSKPAPTTTPGERPKLGAPDANKQNNAQPDTKPPSATPLFVSIDGLKLRKSPGLKSTVVATLKLYEEVYFLNKKSEEKETISLGKESVTDYWVKVRTKSGKEGWVFGAGVHYFKMKRE